MKVRWLGSDREFPSLGRVVRHGDVVELPGEQAQAMIAAGYAEPAADKGGKKDGDA